MERTPIYIDYIVAMNGGSSVWFILLTPFCSVINRIEEKRMKDSFVANFILNVVK